MINENYIVSVPYRGYSFFNARTQCVQADPNSISVSVPYRGYSFFNVIGKSFQFIINNDEVSVPYRGYSFFNSDIVPYGMTLYKSFRPLQGLFVF